MAIALSSDIGTLILLAVIWVAIACATTIISGKHFAQKLLGLDVGEAQSLATKSGCALLLFATPLAALSLFSSLDRVWPCCLLQIITQYLLARRVSPTLPIRAAWKWSAITSLSTTIGSLAINGASWLWLNRYID